LRANNADSVTAFNAAVGAATGLVQFYEPEGHLTNGSLIGTFAAAFSPNVRTVPVVCLSAADLEAVVPKVRRTLLKVDVEGAEALVLDALATFIAERSPDIVLEVLAGYEDAIMASQPLRSGAFILHELTKDGPVEKPRLVASVWRDWWLQPKAYVGALSRSHAGSP
jgi:FkbM family methyltransferase